MKELQKDVAYFTRLWQQEISRREKAETALADLVAAAENDIAQIHEIKLTHCGPDICLWYGKCVDEERYPVNCKIYDLILAARTTAAKVERARKVMKEE